MTNIDQVGIKNIQIPEGYENANRPFNFKVEAEDLIALVSIEAGNTFKVSWIKPDKTEIGRAFKYAGQLVVRKCP